ncbi:hypothetical protein EVAR_28616_1 [Eumeta japonica]|uniref:Uncharacterized protein n=1 Tax=Eumeta variegata TaxID=151549 RepID=A0A4C1XWW7_EUMVA|nr:hypothetical protein EVAR_28616_1 [Eumeta japonica]
MDSCLYDLKEYECGLKTVELCVKCLLYAYEQVILAPSACSLQEMVNEMNDSVKKKSMKADFGKTKVKVFERGERLTECDTTTKVRPKVQCSRDAIAAKYVWSARKDRCRNIDIREQCGLKEDVVTRVTDPVSPPANKKPGWPGVPAADN